MKTTKIFFAITTVILLSVITTGCIPTVPGGNPTPTPQTDTSVVYRNLNIVVAHNEIGVFIADSLDIDSSGTIDISFFPYDGTPGYLTTTVSNEGATEIMSSLFALNDTINSLDPTYTFTTFSTQSDGTTITYIGFKLLLNDGYHYGWLQLKMEAKFYTIFSPTQKIKTTLINYAYKKTPNTPIQAGKY